LIHQDAILQMPADRAREHDFLEVTASAQHAFHCVAMRNAHHILVDDRPFIQCCRDVMGSGADQFDPAFKCLAVWFRANKSWEK